MPIDELSQLTTKKLVVYSRIYAFARAISSTEEKDYK